MATILLTPREFFNFKSLYRGKYISIIDKGLVKVTAEVQKLIDLGYIED